MNAVISRICKLTKSDDRDIQIASIRVLAELHIKDAAVVRFIGEFLQKATTPALKEHLLSIPLKCPHRDFLRYLLPLLQDISISRDRVTLAIAQIGMNAVPVAQETLRDEGGRSRKACHFRGSRKD